MSDFITRPRAAPDLCTSSHSAARNNLCLHLSMPVHNFRKMPTTFPTIWKLFSFFFTWIGAMAGFSG